MKRILLSAIILFMGLINYAQDLSVAVGSASSDVTGVEVEIPFYVSGFSGDYAVTAMEFYIDFDSTLADFVEVRNIWSGTQTYEWFFTQPPTNRFGCNWVQQQLQPIDIPDSTKLFDVVFFYKQPVNVLLDVDEELSVLADDMFQQIPNELINYYNGTIHYGGFIPDTGLVEIIPAGYLSFPDTMFNVPVRLTDFDTENAALSAMELQISFDEDIIRYESILNYNPLLPESQWIISEPGSGKLLMSWSEPASNNVQIPDETFIFEIVFNGVSGGISEIKFDSVSCLFTHQHNGNLEEMYSNFADGEAEIVSVPDPEPGSINFNPNIYATYIDSTFTVPVEIQGFSNGESSLFSMTLEIAYDEADLEFLSVDNFSTILPGDEWEISTSANTLSLTWTDAEGLNIIIPENTIAFEVSFKALELGGTTLNFDADEGVFLHQFYDYTLEYTAAYNSANIQVYDASIPLPGSVSIIPNTYTTNPDSTVTLPFVLSGFGDATSSLSDIELYVDFGDETVSYLSAANFSPLLPESEWNITYDDANSRMVCVWDEPNGQNVSIPNSTTIFELSFQADMVGTTMFAFDSASCLYLHELLGAYFVRAANHSGATVNVEELPPPTPGQVDIDPDSYITYPDSLIAVPIVLSGFNIAGDNDLSDITLLLDFDNSKLEYQSVQNFGAILPENEWDISYDAGNSQMICIWEEPSNQNVVIPDSEVIFELVFNTIDLGESTLEFDVEACVFIHMINGTEQFGSATFGDASVTSIEPPLPDPGLVGIGPGTFDLYVDSSLSLPVIISGFSEPVGALSDIGLYIDFNSDFITYETVENFGTILPENEWDISFDEANSRMVCIWEQPQGENVQIPDGTTVFNLVFTGAAEGTTVLDFDDESCSFIHQQFSGPVELDADFLNATVSVTQFVVPGLPRVKIEPQYIEELSGLEVAVEVVIFGFNLDTTSLTAIEFYIDFDNTAVEFLGADNFNELMPVNQWFYSNPDPGLSRFSCNWAEPTLSNVSVPDSTTLMTLHFKCLENETPLAFDDPLCLFVHIDEEFNLIELPVQYFDGYIQVLPDAIPEEETGELNWLSASYGSILIDGVTGHARVFNITGQLVAERRLLEGTNSINLNQKGIYVVTVITEDKRLLSKKIYIH